jgi:hypothetical protein
VLSKTLKRRSTIPFSFAELRSGSAGSLAQHIDGKADDARNGPEAFRAFAVRTLLVTRSRWIEIR